MNKNIIEGIKILEKYVKPEGFDFACEHDILYFCDYDIVGKEDRIKLDKLDWFREEDSWAKYV
jgi:hypothetical protein